MKKPPVPVLFEDAFLLAVDKPSGMLSVPDRWDKKEENLHAVLGDWTKRKIYVVHRLDRDTSGVILFAKTEDSHRHLSLQFETRFARKEYLALAQGIMPEDSGTMAYPIAHNLRNPGIMISSPFGKFAQTDFTVLDRFPKAGYTWVALRPLTGKTHQIRVHLRCAGHPVAGDEVYGSGEKIYLSRLKKRYKVSKDGEEKPLMGRMALHAHTLKIKHPENDKPLEFTAPVPKDMELTLRYLRKLG